MNLLPVWYFFTVIRRQEEREYTRIHEINVSYFSITLRVDEDNVVSAVVVARMHQHRVEGVVRWHLWNLLEVRV